MKKSKNIKRKYSLVTVTIILSMLNTAWITIQDSDFGTLKNKAYYHSLFNETQLLKLSEADEYFVKGTAKKHEAENYFRKADGFKKVAENFGGKTLKKVQRYEKKAVKSSLIAYQNFFKASDIKFHIYSDRLKTMNTDNSKKQLKAEEISINARSTYIDGTELKVQAEKLRGKNKIDALKLAFDKHLKSIYNQEIALEIYMDDPDIRYDEKSDKITVLKNKNNNKIEQDYSEDDFNDAVNNDAYNSNNDPNIYKSKEEFILSKLNMDQEDNSRLADANDKKTYANSVMNDVDNDYEKIQKIRSEAEASNDDYEKEMKNKMAAGLEDVLFDKMLKAAEMYFNADKTKYDIYDKYLPTARNSNKINEAEKYETNAKKLHADALQRYHKANFYSGHKSNKYIQIMDAVQTELSAIQEQENAFSIYFNKSVKAVTPPIVSGKTNDPNTVRELTYNYSGSYSYSKYNPKPALLKQKNGIIFKVQVGLFKDLLPLSKYGKYSPVSYDTFKNNPYKRFFIGEYRSYKAAEYVLNKIRRKGLTDPFIVSYENGVKKSATYGISKIIRDKDFEKTEAKEMSLLTGDIYKNNDQNNNESTNSEIQTNNEQISDIRMTHGLVYCVQIGNFSSPKRISDFEGISKLFEEKNNTNFKYLTGPFSSYDKAKNESTRLNTSGYKGTFVAVYNNGEKISIENAKKIEQSGFSNKEDFKNSNSGENIHFSVQIAAYSHKLNSAEMKAFNKLSSKYTIHVKQVDGGLYLYIIGNYTNYKEASEVRKEVKALNYDGFVIAFKNGIKISASEAIELLKNK